MNKQKTLMLLTNAGETLVVLGAALWLTRQMWVNVLFVAGALLFAIGRFLEPHPDGGITLRRLYTQRTIGTLVLLVSAALMLFYERLDGIEISDYVVRSTASAWLLPFFIFVALEVYTTFRIAHELKKTAGEGRKR